MVNWNAEDVREFKKTARTLQQEYCDLLGDRRWDAIGDRQWTVLRRKVGFGLYGPPTSTPTSYNRNTGYTRPQSDVIEKICDQLVGDFNSDTHFACIFVVVKVHEKRYIIPVYRAKQAGQNSSTCAYVDIEARKYSSWDDFLQKNRLEKCIYCYPTDGFYESDSADEVCVSFGTSPACDLVSRVFRGGDTLSTAAGITAGAVGLAALCAVPVAGPILVASTVAGASSSAYGIARSSYALYDRASHSQSISFRDAEARACWLSIFGSSLSLAQGRMLARMNNAGQAGRVVGTASRIAYLAIRTGSITISGLGVINYVALLIDKAENNSITPLDMFQFSAAVLFYSNAEIDYNTTGEIIREMQRDIGGIQRVGLREDLERFFKQRSQHPPGDDEMKGKSEVVKVQFCIHNTKDLYGIMAVKNVSSRYKVKLKLEAFKALLEESDKEKDKE